MNDLQERVAAVFDWCASYIDTHGWVQRRAFGDRGAVCPVGALLTSAKCHQAKPVDIARELLTNEVGHIGRWNDTPGREQWEVVTKLREMAKRVRHGDIEVSA